MTEEEALLAARELLKNNTPLRFDCGKLCENACCKEQDEEISGMLLFPGEDALYAGQETWMEIYESDLPFDGLSVPLFVCKLPCPRNLRPLSCRIFPLFPYLQSDGTIRVGIDIRARNLCPLAEHGVEGLSKEFADTVKKAAELLLPFERQRRFLALLTQNVRAYDWLFGGER